MSSVARMLHVEMFSFSISFSVYEVFFGYGNDRFPYFQYSYELCLGNAGVVQVLCRELRACNTLYVHLILLPFWKFRESVS